jgi:hypothetical protein
MGRPHIYDSHIVLETQDGSPVFAAAFLRTRFDLVKMQVSPWHSVKPGETFYHDNTDCKAGELIDLHDLSPGTDGRALCPTCAQLDRNEEMLAMQERGIAED